MVEDRRDEDNHEETTNDTELADDFLDFSDEAQLPEELREDRPDPASTPKTGLVSEFHDLSASQAAYLVANRETSSVARSPLFYVSALVLGLATIAALIIGFQRVGAEAGGNSTLAVVGVPAEQADAFAQQVGIPVVAAETQEAGEEMLRDGEVGALYVLDPTGMGPAQLIALDREPTAILEKLNQPVPVQYVDEPAVASSLADPVGWGMGAVVLLAGLALGAALYQNLRTEKRNRLAEVIASAIPARSSAWGRVYGLTLLSLTYVLVGAGVLLVGLSIGLRTTEAMALLPGLGWFALTAVATVFLVLAAHLWVSTASSKGLQRFGYGALVVLMVAGAVLPMYFRAERTVLQILSFIPFSSPVAMPLRYFAGSAEWWEGLAAAAIAAAVGLLVFLLASAAYRRTLLAGAGRGGRKAVARTSRKAKKAAEKAGVAPAPAADGASASSAADESGEAGSTASEDAAAGDAAGADTTEK
jgi:ABC-2 type transport system permease protein